MTWLDEANKEMKRLKRIHPNWVMMSVAGSQNYGTAIATSDLDLKVAYCPTFKEFYNGSFTSTCKVTDDVDYSVAPIHHYMRYVFKGNMNFWEVWYSPSLLLNEEFWGCDQFIVQNVKDLIEMNWLPNFAANKGMALQKFKKYAKNEDPHCADARKDLQFACRVLSTLKYYFETRKLCLDLPKEYRGNWSSLRQSSEESLIQICVNEYSKLIYWAEEYEEEFAQRSIECAGERNVLLEHLDDWIMQRVHKTMGFSPWPE